MKKFLIFILFILLTAFIYNSSFVRFDSKNNKTFIDLLKWRFTSVPGVWPDEVDLEVLDSLPKMVSSSQIIYINHATFLLRNSDINILFDPIYSEYASPVNFAGPKRVHKPVLDYKLLPEIDYVLISHNHYDHMDIPTLKKLYADFNPKFIVGKNSADYLKGKISKDINVVELNWGESVKDSNLEIYFETASHWSKRSFFDTNFMLWGAFVVKTQDKLIYHAGDSGYDTHFKNMYSKFGEFDFAMLPIGDYEPRWFMKVAHMNPSEAFMAFKDLNAKFGVGMHFNTFKLADNGYKQVQNDFLDASKLDENKDLNFKIPLRDFVFDF